MLAAGASLALARSAAGLGTELLLRRYVARAEIDSRGVPCLVSRGIRVPLREGTDWFARSVDDDGWPKERANHTGATIRTGG